LAGEVDLIIVATSTPDSTFPATATQIQNDLGITRARLSTYRRVLGFVYALTVANSLMLTGQSQCAW